MFRNIGRKIKVFAKVVCWIGIVCSILTGLLVMIAGLAASDFAVRLPEQAGQLQVHVSAGAAIFTGILIIVIGSLVSWIGSFMTYGFGQLIDNTEEIKNSLNR